MDLLFNHYKTKLDAALMSVCEADVKKLTKLFNESSKSQSTIFFVGNGGSAANGEHIVNDLTYGVGRDGRRPFNATALSSNSAVVTCLANDIGYDEIFAHQLFVKARPDDVLFCLSGSGNSKNIIKACKTGKNLNMKLAGIIGYDGGETLDLLDVGVHVKSFDMQICEDSQLIVLHHIFQQLRSYK